ncbi:hypothetical protein BJX66DRAFT_340637 [Aspergillus keveii]|uniref:Uncharacterized protein n=1 Tax=Aspergillus keveii TaxID=714993 RepID=A0ABR4FXM8_9EURO
MLDMIAQEFSIMMRNDEVKAYSFWEERPMSGIREFDGKVFIISGCLIILRFVNARTSCSYFQTVKVVPDFSATLETPRKEMGVDANYVQMCKFASREDNMYGRVIGAIRPYVEAVKGQRTRDEERRITQDLETLPTAVRQRILADQAWNELHLGNISNHVVLRMPQFSEGVLRLGTDYVAPTNRVYGSGAFKLAAILQLSPGQANETLAQVEELGLHKSVHYESTYYSRVSKRGLLKLVSGKVPRVSQEGGSLVAKTSIGSFTFRRIDGKVLVRYDWNDRSAKAAMSEEIDFEDLQRCASRRYRRLERDDSSREVWMEDYEGSTTVRHSWTSPVYCSTAIFFHDLDHPTCPRFMTVEEYHQLEHQSQHNRDILTAFTWLIQILEHKVVLELRAPQVNMSVCRMILGDIASNRGLRPKAGFLDEFLDRCSKFHDDLLEVYGERRSRIEMQNHMLALVERDRLLVAGVGNLALLARANAKFLLKLATPAPDMWIEMILDPERDLWIA